MFRLIALIGVVIVIGFIWFATDAYMKRDDNSKKK